MCGKQAVLKLLEQLPEEATLEEIQYHLYVLQKIKAAQDAIKTGNVIPHDEVMRELAGWLAYSLVGCCARRLQGAGVLHQSRFSRLCPDLRIAHPTEG